MPRPRRSSRSLSRRPARDRRARRRARLLPAGDERSSPAPPAPLTSRFCPGAFRARSTSPATAGSTASATAGGSGRTARAAELQRAGGRVVRPATWTRPPDALRADPGRDRRLRPHQPGPAPERNLNSREKPFIWSHSHWFHDYERADRWAADGARRGRRGRKPLSLRRVSRHRLELPLHRRGLPRGDRRRTGSSTGRSAGRRGSSSDLGTYDETMIAIVSDHGHRAGAHPLRPGGRARRAATGSRPPTTPGPRSGPRSTRSSAYRGTAWPTSTCAARTGPGRRARRAT